MKIWYQYATFGKCDICVRLFSIVWGEMCAEFHIFIIFDIGTYSSHMRILVQFQKRTGICQIETMINYKIGRSPECISDVMKTTTTITKTTTNNTKMKMKKNKTTQKQTRDNNTTPSGFVGHCRYMEGPFLFCITGDNI